MELRHEIKTFLAAQSMIKGHSGSGPHSRGHERPMLRLTVDLDNYSVSSGSPSTPTLSLSTENVHTLPISATLRSVSPYGGSSQGSVHDFTPYHHLPLLDTSTSLASKTRITIECCITCSIPSCWQAPRLQAHSLISTTLTSTTTTTYPSKRMCMVMACSNCLPCLYLQVPPFSYIRLMQFSSDWLTTVIM
jgi:hypothetical protein